MSRLRGYQRDIVNGCYNAWNNGARVVMPVCATGSGKTVMMAEVFRNYQGASAAIAHRSELVGQISMALAREGVPHDIIGDKKVIKGIASEHLEEFGKTFYNPNARCKVASINTLLRRENLGHWIPQVGFAAMDEGHHVLKENMWGRGVQLFRDECKWMLPTATPCRGDKKGLGVHADGLVDVMVEGPSMRALINAGYLTDYHYRGVKPSDLDLSDVAITASGDYNTEQVAAAVKRSNKIVGDVVDTYIKHTPGKLGIVFAVDIEAAQTITNAFNERGVPAALITGDDDADTRRKLLRKFKNRELKVLVNVDLFGEGFDLPAIEVVMFARPTMSYSLYAQQWGRALRLMISKILMGAWDTYTDAQRRQFIAESEKPIAYIHDHVGNLLTFVGPPDKPRTWSLDREAKVRSGGAADAIPLRLCTNPECNQPYERSELCCPWCGAPLPEPVVRKGPEHVDGDLHLYTSEMLLEMYGVQTLEQAEAKVAQAVGSWFPTPVGASPEVVGSLRKKHTAKVESQQRLRMAMNLVMPPTREARVNDKRFYLQFGIDTLKAKLLSSADADALCDRIIASISK